MVTLSIENHVSKTEAARIYRRGLRSLTRDIGKALASRDERVLNNWRLKTIDDAVRQGIEVTTEDVESLHSQGMVPTWWGYEPFLEAEYGRKDSPISKAADSAANNSNSEGPSEEPTNSNPEEAENREPFYLKEPELPLNPEIRAVVLEHHHYLNAKREHSLKQKEQRIEQLTDRILDLVENNQTLQAQSNEIAKMFQDYIKEEGADTKPVLAPTSSPRVDSKTISKPKSATVIDIDTAAPKNVTSKKEGVKKTKQNKAKKKPANKSKTTRNKQAKSRTTKTSTAKKTRAWYARDIRTFFSSNS